MPPYVPVRVRQHRAKKFAAKYAENGFNPTQAVIDCGITRNRNSAHVIGYRLLRNATTKSLIEAHLKEAKISADEVLEELSSIARAPVDKFSESAKLKALELTGKAHKLFTDRVETSDSEPSFKAHLSAEIASLSEENGKSVEEVEQNLQERFANQARKSYDPGLDPTKHPELWPSGNMLRDLEPQSESVS